MNRCVRICMYMHKLNALFEALCDDLSWLMIVMLTPCLCTGGLGGEALYEEREESGTSTAYTTHLQ